MNIVDSYLVRGIRALIETIDEVWLTPAKDWIDEKVPSREAQEYAEQNGERLAESVAQFVATVKDRISNADSRG